MAREVLCLLAREEMIASRELDSTSFVFSVQNKLFSISAPGIFLPLSQTINSCFSKKDFLSQNRTSNKQSCNECLFCARNWVG